MSDADNNELPNDSEPMRWVRKPSTRDRLVEYVWMILLSPVWVPYWMFDRIVLHLKLFKLLRGTTQSAWDRCAVIWIEGQTLCGSEVGATMVTPFAHSISEYFRWYHPNAREFLFKQLNNANPYLAGYALKCLIRYGPITKADIPAEVLQRTEDVRILLLGCCGETMTIGQYIANYFESYQYLQSSETTRK